MRLVTVALAILMSLPIPSIAADKSDDIQDAVGEIKRMQEETKRKEDLRNLISQASRRAGRKVHSALKEAGMNIEICYDINNRVRLSKGSSTYAKRILSRLEDEYGLNVIQEWQQCRKIKERIFLSFFKKELKGVIGVTLSEDSIRAWVEHYLARSYW